AAAQVRRELFAQVAPALGASAADLEIDGGAVRVRGQPGRTLPFREAAGKIRGEALSAQAHPGDDYGGAGRDGPAAVQVAEVAVDVETGVVKVERIVAVHDCGRPLNPLAVQSQVNGGVIGGLSFALYEQRQLDRATGRMVNANLDQYKIAGAREIPRIDTI